VCEYYEVLHVRHYFIVPMLLHWHRGAVALWHRVLHNLEVGCVDFIINVCVVA
jgi:hypothetical protein